MKKNIVALLKNPLIICSLIAYYSCYFYMETQFLAGLIIISFGLALGSAISDHNREFRTKIVNRIESFELKPLYRAIFIHILLLLIIPSIIFVMPEFIKKIYFFQELSTGLKITFITLPLLTMFAYFTLLIKKYSHLISLEM